MNVDKLRMQLEIDEGIVHEIYLDHLGYHTFGIGHLVKESDAEHGLAVGTAISADRCKEAFEQDVESVLTDCERLYVQFEHLPEEVKLKLLRFLEILNLEFAACDFALTEDNELVFFEANVSGNWLWIEDALNFPISETIAKILIKKND